MSILKLARPEIVAMKPYADYDESLGGGFMKPERFMRIVYDSLTR